MSSTVRAAFSGSSGSSQPCGLPVSTEQKRQARVHTDPISIRVAVPAFQHSPMLGHLASSQTVASRCSRTRPLTRAKPAPVGAAGGTLDAITYGGKALRRQVFLAAPRAGRRGDD